MSEDLHNLSPWGPYRVLDLAYESSICGKVFADLGAEVIKVEPPGGDPARQQGPFYHDQPHPERSLSWRVYNTGKKSITLNLIASEGRSLLKRLAEKADFLVESFPPGYLAELGLDHEALSSLNPSLIMASITPFGSSGPRARFKGSDIVVMAMSGHMYLTGDPDGPPLRISVPQAYLHAGCEAALAMMFAHFHRVATGEGQHLDISAQECVMWELFHAQQFWDLLHINLKRQGTWRQFGILRSRTLFPCKDGYVNLMLGGGSARVKSQQALVRWMIEEGMADDWIKSYDWQKMDASTITAETNEHMAASMAPFISTKTKAELFEKALEIGVLLAPVSSPKDLVESPQLRERGFWIELEDPYLGGEVLFPGPPYRSAVSPYQVPSPAPTIGQHNKEVYQGLLGMTRAGITRLQTTGII